MNSRYKYEGVPLTRGVAMEIIIEVYSGQPAANKTDIVEAVVKHHENRGGLPAEAKPAKVVAVALGGLSKEGSAEHLTVGYWRIYPLHELGSGASSVYLYYFPTFRKEAKAQGKPFWKCKIGWTDQDPRERVEQQTRPSTGIPEDPIVALIIKTDIPQVLEKAIHGVLTARGRHVEEAKGTEWFLTSPVEVKRIYTFIETMDKLPQT